MRKIKLISSFKPRSYQESVFASSSSSNSLIVLPTGLGKTVISLMLAIYNFNKHNRKVLFLAPTKPLVEQQKKSYEEFIENSNEFKFQVLTGLVQPEKREKLYVNSDFIFSTPQLIENDIINQILDISNFGFLIIDEAHRATGGYAYSFIAQEFSKKNIQIIGLTASPGTSKEEIREVMTNLRTENIVVKRYSDLDVRAYVNKTKIENVEVELSEELLRIKKLLEKTYNKRLEILKTLGVLDEKKILTTKRDLLDLQIQLREKVAKGEQNEIIWKAISVAAGLMKLQYGQELFESQDLNAAYTYFHNFFRASGDQSKAAQELLVDIDFREAYDIITRLNREGVLHPKLVKLKELVNKRISKFSDLKIIVFNQYRESAQTIVRELKTLECIEPVLFVGQAKKGEVKMSQKEQKRILEDFRDSKYNVLVSTSVGEEGLDIPKVDLVIFYEPVPSAIRQIQRIGRTGRFNEGNAFILQTKGTRDIVTNHIANAKERRMHRVLDEISLEHNRVDNSLNKFLEDNKSKIEVERDDRISIYVDSRENNDLIKEFYKVSEVKVIAKHMEVGDIVITDDIAIERKSKKDFVNSILDKRLFPQLIDLARNFKRPILLLEGEENIYSIRNLSPNVIRATFSAISVDLRIPILNTHSLYESAQMIVAIAKRTRREKREISLVSEKGGLSEYQEMEKFVSSIPKVNVFTAKSLLQHFGSIKELVNSTEEKLQECAGVGRVRARALVEFFRRKYKSL